MTGVMLHKRTGHSVHVDGKGGAYDVNAGRHIQVTPEDLAPFPKDETEEDRLREMVDLDPIGRGWLRSGAGGVIMLLNGTYVQRDGDGAIRQVEAPAVKAKRTPATVHARLPHRFGIGGLAAGAIQQYDQAYRQQAAAYNLQAEAIQNELRSHLNVGYRSPRSFMEPTAPPKPKQPETDRLLDELFPSAEELERRAVVEARRQQAEIAEAMTLGRRSSTWWARVRTRCARFLRRVFYL